MTKPDLHLRQLRKQDVWADVVLTTSDNPDQQKFHINNPLSANESKPWPLEAEKTNKYGLAATQDKAAFFPFAIERNTLAFGKFAKDFIAQIESASVANYGMERTDYFGQVCVYLRGGGDRYLEFGNHPQVHG